MSYSTADQAQTPSQSNPEHAKVRKKMVCFPEVTGRYCVGTESFRFIDETRGEAHTADNPADKRELMVQFWYPADVPDDAERALWLPDHDIFILQAKNDFPQIPFRFWDNFGEIRANAVSGAPFSRFVGKCPVVVYIHGWMQSRTENTYLMEELASHGYVTVAIDFPYDSRVVRFPDGRVVSRGPRNWDFNCDALDDVRFVVQEMSKPNGPARSFTDRLDFGRIAVAGFSAGGGVTIGALQSDSTFKAGLIIDFRIKSDDLMRLRKPFMVLGETTTPVVFSTNPSDFLASGYLCTVENTGHWDFTDITLVWRLLNIPGKLHEKVPANDPLRIHRVTADYSLAFFDKHLKGKRTPLLDSASKDYREVNFRILGSR